MIAYCKVCSKEFETKAYFIKRGQGQFCSLDCYRSTFQKGKTVVCTTCRAAVYRTAQQLRRSKSKLHFCSKSCQTVWRNKVFSGEKHKLWKNGESTYRKLLERAKRPLNCARCKMNDPRVLAAHHVDGNHRNNKLENLMWLCHNCHLLVHRDKVEAQKLMVPMV